MQMYMCVYVFSCMRMCVHTVKVCICVPLTGGKCHSRESGGPCVSEVKHAEKGKHCTFLLRYGSRGSQAHRDDSGVSWAQEGEITVRGGLLLPTGGVTVLELTDQKTLLPQSSTVCVVLRR